MAIKWSWQFHNESETDLDTLGFNTYQSNQYPYTDYSFSPHGAAVTGSTWSPYNSARYVGLPTEVGPDEGAFCMAQLLLPAEVFNNVYHMYIRNANGGIFTYTNVSDKAIRLYVDDVLKATGDNVDVAKWNFWTLKYSMTGSTWYASVWLNGSEYLAEASDAEAAQSSGQDIRFYGSATNGNLSRVANLIVYDKYADDSEKVRYVSRISPNADTSETGTWAPDSGTDNFARLGGAYNSSTYTQETSPTDGDEVITSFSGTIAATLAVTPTAINAVTVHGISTGLNNVARIEVGDQGGSGTTAGAYKTISNTSTYQFATATTQPTDGGDGAWVVGDTIKCKYEYSGSA